MKTRMTQFILLGALALLVIQVVLIAPRQIRDESSAVSPTAAVNEPAPGPSINQSMKGMHMIETREGGKEWELWSERANSLRDKDLSELIAVRAIFFSNSGLTFTVTGQKGTVQVKTKNMRIEGDVVTRSSNGYVFKTSNLEYNSETRELLTDAPVEMLGPEDGVGHSLKLTGTGVKAQMREGTIHVQHDVKAEKTLDNSKKAFIRSNSGLFSGKERMAKFTGDVILDLDSMRITGPEAEFDYDPKKDSVRSVVFSSGAKVSDADKWATSQNLRVDFETNKFVFRGSPRLVQNNDELRGEEIIFLDGGKRVQVLRARAKVDEKRLEKVN